ncbi:hypothetical protein L208DRAFT_1363338 [Tricholoma matsutake]|nr:hypothetical protein L208DRAFT_1363338 [Tricholoma matsutake 945]
MSTGTSVDLPSAAVPASVTSAPVSRPNGGQDLAPSPQGLDLWSNSQKYEATLQEVNKTSSEPKFRDEVAAIEQWFKVLSEAERTASIYTLLLHSNQDQIRFFGCVLQQMIRPEVGNPDNAITEDHTKPKQGIRNTRPPSLNLPLPGSPTTPRFNPLTAAKDGEPLDVGEQDKKTSLNAQSQQSSSADSDVERKANDRPSMTITPLPLKDAQTTDDGIKDPGSADPHGISRLPGIGMMSPYHLNMIANAGLSSEAQLLAVQLVMGGLVQPAKSTAAQTQRQPPHKNLTHLGEAKNWRTPTSAKYPGSALRSSFLRSSALKSAGLKSAGLQSAGLNSSGLDTPNSSASPKIEDFDPEMLNDIPAWLRTLRLHKYTACFDGLPWQELVVLDDATLESKGIIALGARRRLLRTFEHVRKVMGMDSPSSATPTTSSLVSSTLHVDPAETQSTSPRSASKLSVDSPVFIPSIGRVPQTAAPTVSVVPAVESS